MMKNHGEYINLPNGHFESHKFIPVDFSPMYLFAFCGKLNTFWSLELLLTEIQTFGGHTNCSQRQPVLAPTKEALFIPQS